MISVDDMILLKTGQEISDARKVYGCVTELSDIVQPESGDGDGDGDGQIKIDRQHYYDNPDLYEPVFHERVAPYTNVLVNGIYWDQRFPRLLTKRQIMNMQKPSPSPSPTFSNSLLAIADISCDIGGSIEFLERSSTIDNPFYRFDTITGRCSNELGTDTQTHIIAIAIT